MGKYYSPPRVLYITRRAPVREGQKSTSSIKELWIRGNSLEINRQPEVPTECIDVVRARSYTFASNLLRA